MTFDQNDKGLADAIEAIIKDTQINGIPGYTESVLTAAQYTPTGNPDITARLPADFNKTMAIAIAAGLRTHPLRLPMIARASLPPPIAGALVIVVDLTSSNLAFSDGSAWIDI